MEIRRKLAAKPATFDWPKGIKVNDLNKPISRPSSPHAL
jgi:hypothetical protein